LKVSRLVSMDAAVQSHHLPLLGQVPELQYVLQHFARRFLRHLNAGKSGKFLIASGRVLYAHSTIFSKLASLEASIMRLALRRYFSLMFAHLAQDLHRTDSQPQSAVGEAVGGAGGGSVS